MPPSYREVASHSHEDAGSGSLTPGVTLRWTLGEAFSPTELQFPHLQDADDKSIHLSGLILGINASAQAKP